MVGLLPGETHQPPPRVVLKNQGYVPFADAPIYYRSSELSDPVARLEERLERGEITLSYEPQHGYLRSVLDALHVPVNSQTLVFSKTSFQFPQITPSTPRALYFNDDVYVGQVDKGKFLEFVSFDPRQGAIFYVMDEHRSPHPRFERASVDCVQCHVAPATHGVPGVFLRSVFTRPTGYQVGGSKSYVTGQESPVNERWGGWYVTSTSGAETAMGNGVVSDAQHPDQLDRSPVNLSDLSGRVKCSAYLTESSDIVALMLLAHQTQMHNLITQANYKTRIAIARQATSPQPAADASPDSDAAAVEQALEAPAEQLVRYLLFSNEAQLRTPIAGNTNFADQFASLGPFDAHGRSLRQFDLHRRIFKYPCSYLFYSESFDALPAPAKNYVYRRLFEVLSGRDQSPAFDHLSSQDRRAILEILVDTKPGLPPEWRQYLAQQVPIVPTPISAGERAASAHEPTPQQIYRKGNP